MIATFKGKKITGMLTVMPENEPAIRCGLQGTFRY